MKRKNIYIILLLSMFALTSCKVGKSYVRPEMALPDSLAPQQDSMRIADEEWQAVYTDSTPRGLIDCAVEYNKDMLIASSPLSYTSLRAHETRRTLVSPLLRAKKKINKNNT